MPPRPFSRSSARTTLSWPFLTNQTHLQLAIHSERVGRRNRYEVIGDTARRHHLEEDDRMGGMLDLLEC